MESKLRSGIRQRELANKMKNILLIGYDSNICLGVTYCLRKMDNTNLFLLTNNNKNAGKFSRFVKKTIYYKNDVLNIQLLKQIIDEYKISLVFPYDENEGIKISSLKKQIEAFNCQTIWLTDINNYKIGVNKLLLAKALSAANIKTPIFYQNSIQMELFEKLDEWKGEILMKPIRSSFGRGIVRFLNNQEIKEYLLTNKIELSNFFFQPYIEGSDLTVNVIASKGKILHYTIQETPIKNNLTFMSGDDFEFKEDNKVLKLIEDAIELLNWNGIACFDLRRDMESGELFILEINGRFWASLLAALKRGGINFPLLMATYAMDKQIESIEKKYDYQISLNRLFREIIKGKFTNWSKTKYNLYLVDPLARFYQILRK